jgi:hypothetical protein
MQLKPFYPQMNKSSPKSNVQSPMSAAEPWVVEAWFYRSSLASGHWTLDIGPWTVLGFWLLLGDAVDRSHAPH